MCEFVLQIGRSKKRKKSTSFLLIFTRGTWHRIAIQANPTHPDRELPFRPTPPTLKQRQVLSHNSWIFAAEKVCQYELSNFAKIGNRRIHQNQARVDAILKSFLLLLHIFRAYLLMLGCINCKGSLIFTEYVLFICFCSKEFLCFNQLTDLTKGLKDHKTFWGGKMDSSIMAFSTYIDRVRLKNHLVKTF